MYGCIESKSMWVRGCDMRSLLILSHSSLWSIDSPSNTCSPISVSVISIVSRVPSLFVSPFYCSIPSPSPSYRAPPPLLILPISSLLLLPIRVNSSIRNRLLCNNCYEVCRSPDWPSPSLFSISRSRPFSTYVVVANHCVWAPLFPSFLPYKPRPPFPSPRYVWPLLEFHLLVHQKSYKTKKIVLVRFSLFLSIVSHRGYLCIPY